MSNKKMTDGSLALANQIITIEATQRPEDIKLRVAAYARVSTDSDDQQNSFVAQMRYYASLISSKENWSMVDIYADEGITGTSKEKREDFKRLIADCHKGLIDRVLVKSISRFARNTVECLETIRELRQLGVSIWFEEQNIDTAKVSGEMLTAMFAAMAQAESESIAGNMRWSYQRRMQNGSFNTCFAPYGFRLQDGKLVIQESEAEVIKYIFSEYLSGKSPRDIAKRLTMIDCTGKAWDRKLIEYILQNERYAGNALLQKKYTTDTLPRQEKRNKGEREMYLVYGSNDPIVDQEIFDKAQRLRERRTRECMSTRNPQALSKAMSCGCCGRMLRPKPVYGKMYMVCRTHEHNREQCGISEIREDEVFSAFLRLYYKLKHQGMSILRQMLTNLHTIRMRRMLWSEDIVGLNNLIYEISSQNHMLAEFNKQGLIDPDIFISRSNELAEKLRSAKLKKERLVEAERDDTFVKTQELIEIIESGPDFLETFDGELFSELIEKIIVESNERLRFRLKNGLELAEPIERTVR